MTNKSFLKPDEVNDAADWLLSHRAQVSLQDVADLLMERGITNPITRKGATRQAIAKILKDPRNIGGEALLDRMREARNARWDKQQEEV